MRLLIVGFGNVGQNLARLLSSERDETAKRVKDKIRVVGIIDSKTQLIDSSGIDLRLSIKRKEQNGSVGRERRADFKEVLERCDPDAVIELTNTNPVDGEPGFTHIREAIVSGRDVVTTNKGPIALYFQALRELASRNNVRLKFSGTVGAGTPILEFGKMCATGDDILSIKGILNSTSNYVLSLMETYNISLNKAIVQARRLGYAEADSSMDISGKDSMLKLVIIVNYLLGKRITPADVKTEGIEKIGVERVRDALKRRKRIRLVASTEKGYRVCPEELEALDPLCVSGPLISLSLQCRYSGTKYIIGQGAGGIATAVAVLRDVISLMV